MIPRSHDESGNLTLSEADIARSKPMSTHGGRRLRAFCPFHGSDHQRSLSVDNETGHFSCFACGAWGYTTEARDRWRQEKAGLTSRPLPSRFPRSANVHRHTFSSPFAHPESPSKNPDGRSKPKVAVTDSGIVSEETSPGEPCRPDLDPLLKAYQEALPCSPGQRYLESRRIPLDLANAMGLGYAASGHWVHRARDCKSGRLVFPHTNPEGRVVNLYGRAVETTPLPKSLRHDHLPGSKGYFNASALLQGSGPLFVCEGPFDALSLMAAGHTRVVAIFGVHGWRWEWARSIRELVFAFDADEAGGRWKDLARQAVLLGRKVAFLTPEDYGGCKDVNEAWVAGTLTGVDGPEACSSVTSRLAVNTIQEA